MDEWTERGMDETWVAKAACLLVDEGGIFEGGSWMASYKCNFGTSNTLIDFYAFFSLYGC